MEMKTPVLFSAALRSLILPDFFSQQFPACWPMFVYMVISRLRKLLEIVKRRVP